MDLEDKSTHEEMVNVFIPFAEKQANLEVLDRKRHPEEWGRSFLSAMNKLTIDAGLRVAWTPPAKQEGRS
jgi:hypothetical protein